MIGGGVATLERIKTDSGRRAQEVDGSQQGAIEEGSLPNGRNPAGNGHAREADAATERLAPDPRDAVGNHKTATARDRELNQDGECLVVQNSIHARVGCIGCINLDGGDLTAKMECSVADARDAAGDGEADEAAA